MKAFITGAAGQDGYYLAKELHDHGYEVVGLYRGQEETRLAKLREELPFVEWERGDVTDPASMDAIIQRTKPDAIYNLAACSYVGASWEMPRLYMETNYGGLINVMEAVRRHAAWAHVVQASSSEMFGNVGAVLLDEDSPMRPASPYGVSKLAAHRICGVYRDSYGMHVSSAISFNHESPRRPELFVTRKVTKAAAEGRGVTLGNIVSARDWGYAADYMQAYRLMTEDPVADDYVIATGQAHCIGELCESAFGPDWRERVTLSESNERPNDLIYLCGNAGKIRSRLGWKPTVGFEELIRMMVDADRVAVPV